MPERRPLTNEERAIYLKRKPKVTSEKEFLETEKKIIEFKRDVMLEHSLKKQRKDFDKQIKLLDSDIETLKFSEKIMGEHLRRGVVIKKKIADEVEITLDEFTKQEVKK